MITFFKNAIRELNHVVWPTKNETKKYFLTVMIVLVLFGLYLFIANSIFSSILFALKDTFSPSAVSLENKLPNFDVSSLKVQTGAVTGTGNMTGTGGVAVTPSFSQTGTTSNKKVK